MRIFLRNLVKILKKNKISKVNTRNLFLTMEISSSRRTRTPMRHNNSSISIRNCTPIEAPPSVRFLYLNIRPRSYATAPSTKVISYKSSGSTGLGPGKYEIQNLSKAPSFEFSKVPRFGEESVFELLSRAASRQKTRRKGQIDINKILSFESPNAKRKKAEELMKKKKIKLEIVKLTRDNILRNKKVMTEETIREKHKKSEYIKRKKEIKNIKITWIVMNCAVGVAFVIKKFIKNRKVLRNRVSKLYKVLQQVVRCVGRIRIILKDNRRKKALKLLKVFLIPYTTRWLRNKKKKYRKSVVWLIEKALSRSMLFKSIASWRESIIHVQRSLKFCIYIKKLLYAKLISLWNNAESLFFHKKNFQNLQKKGKKKQPKNLSTIPTEIKLHYLSLLMKSKVLPYIQAMQSYKAIFLSIREENQQKEFEILSKIEKPLPYPPKPSPLKLLKSTTEQEILDLIHVAEQERSKWPSIITISRHKLQSSYK